jgi:UDP-N-acetylglucosamine transferase subunit ALG13
VIFVTVGSMFPFDRLAKGADEWAERNPRQPMLVQIGTGSYVPRFARSVRMLRPTEFGEAVGGATLVVAHLGMGSIITAMQARKPIVLMPRIFDLGEHTSDHQMHGTDWLRGRPGIWIADDVDALHHYLDAFRDGSLVQGSLGVEPHASTELIGRVRAFISGPDTGNSKPSPEEIK